MYHGGKCCCSDLCREGNQTDQQNQGFSQRETRWGSVSPSRTALTVSLVHPCQIIPIVDCAHRCVGGGSHQKDEELEQKGLLQTPFNNAFAQGARIHAAISGLTTAVVTGCCRCLSWTPFPPFPKGLTQIRCKLLALNQPFRGPESLPLCFFSCSYTVICLCFFLSFFIIVILEKEKPTGGKKDKCIC